ncbi:MAG: meso-butanediol dehydrogenase/(S,S)-butanediol dehydrogenase/diacetyl reductase [Gammaproteobacteria bacterium]
MLLGKTILVTGATSGIGMTTAEVCAREGARVFASGRNTEAGALLMDRLAGSDHKFFEADLADRSQAESLIIQVSKFGQLDGLINSAGIAQHATVTETSNSLWDDTIAINLNAVFYLCRAIIPRMIAQGGGVIVNVASTWGLVGAEQSAAYCASKGAVIQLTRAMAMDHAGQNVRINAVAPGAVDTPMLEAEAAEFGLSAEEGKKLWAADAPSGTLATASDVAETIAFLMSDKARHIHGTVIPIDGGALAG